MRYLTGICIPFLLQTVITYVIVSMGSGGGSFVELGALLFALIGIPATAIVNFALIKARPTASNSAHFGRSLLVSLVLPLVQLGLVVAVSGFRLQDNTLMSRYRVRIAALLATMMSFTALGQTPADEIRESRDQFNAAIARHDVEAVMSFLDVEYQITTGRGDLMHGRAGEADGWRAEFARADDLVYVRTPETIEVSASGERAAEIGSWVGSWTTPGGPHRASGRYAAHWRRVHESWKIRAELFVTLRCEGVDCS